MAKLLVSGSRAYQREAFLREQMELAALDLGFTGLVVVHGDCPTGADRMAKQWALEQYGFGVREERHPAEWARFGAYAGPKRNRDMVERGADRVLAFPHRDSKGTWGLVDLAMAAGLDVRVFH